MSEPSRFYRQHHALEAPVIDSAEFRPFWRVRTRCDQLLIDGAISYAEWRAAQIFRTLAERVLAAAWRTRWLDTPEGRSQFGLALQARHDALKCIAQIRAKLGNFALDLLEAHLIEDMKWSELAELLGIHPRTARAWIITVLKALAVVMWR